MERIGRHLRNIKGIVEAVGILQLWAHWKASFKSEKDAPLYVLICPSNTFSPVFVVLEAAMEEGHIMFMNTSKDIGPGGTTIMGLSQNFAFRIKAMIGFLVRMPVLIGKISSFLSRRMGIGYRTEL
jgi:hypothetical protein